MSDFSLQELGFCDSFTRLDPLASGESQSLQKCKIVINYSPQSAPAEAVGIALRHADLALRNAFEPFRVQAKRTNVLNFHTFHFSRA